MTEKKPIGRPRTLAERPERKGICLGATEWEQLREIGGGLYVAGIRRLLEWWENAGKHKC
jgi:hypothetical protein